MRRKDHWEVDSTFDSRLKELENELAETKETRLLEIKEEANELQHLSELSSYDLSPTDKKDYLYLVKPQLHTISKMVDAGMTEVEICKTLNVTYAGMKRMREQIPELDEIYYLGKLSKIQKAEENLFRLAESQVLEEQMITRDGDVVTVQKVIPPNFQAVKFVLERLKAEEYKPEMVVTHTSAYGHELTEMLDGLDAESLKRILDGDDAIDITEEVSVTDHE